MQPQNFESRGGQEQQPVPAPTSVERIPVLPTPESGIQTGAERREQTAEAQAAVADATGAPVPIAVPQQPVVDPATPSAAPVVSTAPAIAADVDVIEKEWVDKAKQIISSTKDDPYKRSAQVGELQRDYLKKRYGKDLGAA